MQPIDALTVITNHNNLEELRKLLSGDVKPEKMAENKGKNKVVTSCHHKIVPFSA